MEKSPLMRLSAELRNRIYAEVMLNPEGITIDCCDYMLDPKRVAVTLPHISLTRTCQQLRLETLKMYYFLNPMTVLASTSSVWKGAHQNVTSSLIAFTSVVGTDQMSAIRRVSFRLLFIIRQWPLSNEFEVLDRASIRSIRRMFDPLACFEVHFEVRASLLRDFVLKVTWDIDQPIEQLKSRLFIAENEEYPDSNTYAILSGFVRKLVETGICHTRFLF